MIINECLFNNYVFPIQTSFLLPQISQCAHTPHWVNVQSSHIFILVRMLHILAEALRMLKKRNNNQIGAVVEKFANYVCDSRIQFENSPKLPPNSLQTQFLATSFENPLQLGVGFLLTA